MPNFSYTRLYTGDDGNSYFEDVPIETPNANPLGKLSGANDVKHLFFRRSIPQTYDWHPAPNELYIVYLTGEAEVEASGGETRIFKAGDILLATDTHGKGHRSTILTEGTALIIILEK